eukprot:911412-Prorocentrum_minimum.AAC.2
MRENFLKFLLDALIVIRRCSRVDASASIGGHSSTAFSFLIEPFTTPSFRHPHTSTCVKFSVAERIKTVLQKKGSKEYHPLRYAYPGDESEHLVTEPGCEGYGCARFGSYPTLVHTVFKEQNLLSEERPISNISRWVLCGVECALSTENVPRTMCRCPKYV